MNDESHGGDAGAQFGKYRIVRKLGEGAFGAVYEAVLPGPMGFTKRLAVKKLRSYLVAEDPKFVQSMVNEARIGGLLHHDNIVDVVEFDQVGENYYIAMEYVDGLTLTEVVQICRHKQTLLPRFAILKLANDVCRGLHYAHEFRGADGEPLNLVHRDLKPSNIIVNDAGTAKVLDFGIAKAASNLFNTTASAMSKGTPRYMSPEQISCEGPLDRRSDIFSLGAVLFELVTGRVLFDSESLPGLALKIIGGLPEAELDEAEAAFPGTRPILERALQKDPADRFQDAQAVSAALMALGQDYPPQADMGEVVKRLLPAKDLSQSVAIKSTGDLNLATGGLPPSTDLDELSDQQPIPPPDPSSAGWDQFTEAFDKLAITGQAPEVPTSGSATVADPTPPAATPDGTVSVFAGGGSPPPSDATVPGFDTRGTTPSDHAPLRPSRADRSQGGATGSTPEPSSIADRGRKPRWMLGVAVGGIVALAVVVGFLIAQQFGDDSGPILVAEMEPGGPGAGDALADAGDALADAVEEDVDEAEDEAPAEPDAGDSAADGGAMPPPVADGEPESDRADERESEREADKAREREREREEAEREREREEAEANEDPVVDPEPGSADATAQPGTVSIRSKPVSKIYVDGTLIKESVILKKHPLPGGRHTVKLVCDAEGGASKSFTVEIDGQDAGLGCWDFTASAPCGG